MDVLTLLRNDHRRVGRLFDEHKQASGNARRQKAVFDEIRRELDVHAQIEEKLFYAAMDGGLAMPMQEQMEEARAEHEEVKALLKQMAGLAPEDAGYAAAFPKLVDGVRRHVAEEEGTIFPAAREFLGMTRLKELGREMVELKAQLGPEIVPAVAAAVKAAKRVARTPRGTRRRPGGGRPRSSGRRRG
jgi:hemerythrin superfamily protein